MLHYPPGLKQQIGTNQKRRRNIQRKSFNMTKRGIYIYVQTGKNLNSITNVPESRITLGGNMFPCRKIVRIAG